LKAVFTSVDEARNFYRKCGDSVETLVGGKWQKYVVTPISTQASGVVIADPVVLSGEPLSLEVQPSSESDAAK